MQRTEPADAFAILVTLVGGFAIIFLLIRGIVMNGWGWSARWIFLPVAVTLTALQLPYDFIDKFS